MRNWKTALALAAVLALASQGLTQPGTIRASTNTAVTNGTVTTITVGPGKIGATALVSCEAKVVVAGKAQALTAVPALPPSGPTGTIAVTSAGPATALRLGIAGIKVTSVNGSTIAGTTLGSDMPITVTVTVTTTYTEAGMSVSLTDVHAGSDVAVCGTPGDDNTIRASSVSIVLPEARGVITAVDGTDLTVVGEDGSSHIVATDGATTVRKLDQTAALGDLTAGTAVDAYGTYQSDQSLLATVVDVELPSVAGKVTAISGNDITIESDGLGDPAPTIVTSDQTTYKAKDQTQAATAASVTVGSTIVATGTESVDGATLNALQIAVLPAFTATTPSTGQ